MLPVRVAFDPALPVVVAAAFTIGDRAFKDGDPLSWREIGIDEATLLAFWRSGLVAFVATPTQPPVPPPPLEQPRREKHRHAR